MNRFKKLLSCNKVLGTRFLNIQKTRQIKILFFVVEIKCKFYSNLALFVNLNRQRKCFLFNLIVFPSRLVDYFDALTSRTEVKSISSKLKAV